MHFLFVCSIFCYGMRIIKRYILKKFIFASEFILREMDNKRKLFGVLGGQLVFFVFFFEYFTKNSFLRPSVNDKTEFCIALMLILAMFANYWLLLLLFRKKNTMFLYLLFSGMEVIITALIEYILTIEAKLSVVPNEMIAVYGSLIKKRFFFNLLLRNSGLLCFVGLVSDNFRLRIKILQDKERQLFREKHKLEVQQFFDKSSILLDEDEICYITQNQNYNTFVTVSGAKYTKRGTLNNLQDLLGENNYVKISRSVIVRLKYVKSVSNNNVELLMGDNMEDFLLPVSTSYISTAIPTIEDFLKKKKLNQTEFDFILTTMPQKAQQIHHYIAYHPNCKLNDIVTETHIPKSTTTRYIKEMQDEGLIEYTGSKRTGGYKIVNRTENRHIETAQEQEVTQTSFSPNQRQIPAAGSTKRGKSS